MCIFILVCKYSSCLTIPITTAPPLPPLPKKKKKEETKKQRTADYPGNYIYLKFYLSKDQSTIGLTASLKLLKNSFLSFLPLVSYSLLTIIH